MFAGQLLLLPKLVGWQFNIFVELYSIFVKFSSFLVLASKTLTLSTNKLDKDIILLHKYFWRKSSLAHAAPTPKEH